MKNKIIKPLTGALILSMLSVMAPTNVFAANDATITSGKNTEPKSNNSTIVTTDENVVGTPDPDANGTLFHEPTDRDAKLVPVCYPFAYKDRNSQAATEFLNQLPDLYNQGTLGICWACATYNSVTRALKNENLIKKDDTISLSQLIWDTHINRNDYLNNFPDNDIDWDKLNAEKSNDDPGFYKSRVISPDKWNLLENGRGLYSIVTESDENDITTIINVKEIKVKYKSKNDPDDPTDVYYLPKGLHSDGLHNPSLSARKNMVDGKTQHLQYYMTQKPLENLSISSFKISDGVVCLANPNGNKLTRIATDAEPPSGQYQPLRSMYTGKGPVLLEETEQLYDVSDNSIKGRNEAELDFIRSFSQEDSVNIPKDKINTPIARLTQVRMLKMKTLREQRELKAWIQRYGAVSVYMPNIAHAETIMGWDDNYTDKAGNKVGGWLIKNSWSYDKAFDDRYSYSWYTYEEMQDSICYGMAFEKPDYFDNIYQHDGSSDEYNTWGTKKTQQAANTFVVHQTSANSKSQILTSVGFEIDYPPSAESYHIDNYTDADETVYSVEIIKNRKGATDPTDGKKQILIKTTDPYPDWNHKYELRGTVSKQGIYTLDLNSLKYPIELQDGDQFSVIVKLVYNQVDSDGSLPETPFIAQEKPIYKTFENSKLYKKGDHSNQSFRFVNGIWKDAFTQEDGFDEGAYRIKAMTKNVESAEDDIADTTTPLISTAINTKSIGLTYLINKKTISQVDKITITDLDDDATPVITYDIPTKDEITSNSYVNKNISSKEIFGGSYIGFYYPITPKQSHNKIRVEVFDKNGNSLPMNVLHVTHPYFGNTTYASDYNIENDVKNYTDSYYSHLKEILTYARGSNTTVIDLQNIAKNYMDYCLFAQKLFEYKLTDEVNNYTPYTDNDNWYSAPEEISSESSRTLTGALSTYGLSYVGDTLVIKDIVYLIQNYEVTDPNFNLPNIETINIDSEVNYDKKTKQLTVTTPYNLQELSNIRTLKIHHNTATDIFVRNFSPMMYARSAFEMHTDYPLMDMLEAMYHINNIGTYNEDFSDYGVLE